MIAILGGLDMKAQDILLYLSLHGDSTIRDQRPIGQRASHFAANLPGANIAG